MPWQSWRRPVTARGAALLAALFLAAPTAFASTLYVAPTGDDALDGLTWASAKKTIQAALNAASAQDTVLVAQGTYNERITVPAQVSVSGGYAGPGTANPDEQAPSSYPAVIDGGNDGSVVTLSDGTSLEGVTIGHGTGTEGIGGRYGGGIYAPLVAHVAISFCRLIENSADFGAGIFITNSAATDTDPAAANVVSFCIFYENSAALSGGSVYAGSGSVTFDHNLFVSGQSGLDGAALYLNGLGPNTLVYGNVIESHTASRVGGGIFAHASQAKVFNNTLYGNTDAAGVSGGGGIYLSADSAVTVANNILVNNSSGLHTTSASQMAKNNDAWGNTAFDFADPTVASSNSNISADPGFTDASGDDFTLQSTSPCKDAGTDEFYNPNVPELFLDLSGSLRLQGAHVDIGAYEIAGTRLIFSIPPAGGAAGQPFLDSGVVSAADLDTGAALTNFSGPVTLTLKPGVGPADAVLSGTTTVTATAGQAAFSDLSIDKPGTYILMASAPGFEADSQGVLIRPDGTWDIARDFSLAANPNGEWSYGWTPGSRTDPVTLDVNKQVENAWEFWSKPPDNGTCFHNTTGDTITAYNWTLDPHAAAMHPGGAGEQAVTVWTAPADGRYRAQGQFEGISLRNGDTSGTTTDVAVLHGDTELAAGYINVNGHGNIVPFDVTVAMRKGETLKFTVGTGNGAYDYDATQISATIAPTTATASAAVPGTSNPWLAGMPDGSTAKGDFAPSASPVLVNARLTPGTSIQFDVTGSVNYAPDPSNDPPDGHLGYFETGGPVNGIAGVTAVMNCLLGVFLDDTDPFNTATPAWLSFGDAAALDYTTLRPDLRQVFFIGDGQTSAGVRQSVVIPAGATRLYLGTMDISSWNNNSGQFNVAMTLAAGSAAPFGMADAATALKIAGGLLGAGAAYNVETTGDSAGRVDLADALRIARKSAGLDSNP